MEAMSTDKNKVSELLMSDERIDEVITEQYEAACEAEVSYDGDALRPHLIAFRDIYEAELARLRQERDELVGEIRAALPTLNKIINEVLYEDGECHSLLDVTISNLQRVLSKHKPQ